MKTERIIRYQARQRLKNNWSTVLSGVFVLFGFVLLPFLYVFVLLCGVGATDSDGLLLSGYELVFLFAAASAAIFGVLLTPAITGFFRMCCIVANGGAADLSDSFYFFKGNKYASALVFNLRVILRLIIAGVIVYLPFIIFSSTLHLLILDCVMFAIGTLLLIFYSLKLFTATFLFAGYEASVSDSFFIADRIFRRSISDYILLFYSFVPWLLLCFFVLPALYVLPYAICSAATSSKWLIKLYKDGKMV